MAAICENCGKVSAMGRAHTHKRGIAGKRWRKRTTSTLRSYKINIQKATVMLSGKPVKMNLCTSCISRFKRQGKIQTGKRPKIASI